MAAQDVFDRVLERWSLQPEDLEVGPQVLGAGSFGEVRAGTLRDGNSSIQVAVKLLPMNGNCEETWNKIGAEAVLLAKVSERCKSTSRLYGICRKDDKFCLVMKKYVTSLEKKINEYPDRKAPRKKVEQWALDICQAVAELHGQSVIFRDLKPSNVLLDEFGGAILADFGISKMVERTVAQRRTSTTVAGTLNYMAPETFTARAEERSSKVDVWALGCLLLELYTGKAPWEGLDMANIMYQVLSLKGHPSIPLEMNRDLVDALEQCFIYDPAKRASAMIVLEALRKAYYQAPERSASHQEKCHVCSSFGILATCLQCTSKFSMKHTPPSSDSRSSHTKSFYSGPSKEKAASSFDEELFKDDPYQSRCWGAMAEVTGEAKIVVGLDFGERYSGYAFAHKSKPEEILVFNDWPRATKSYCKTLTVVYYEPGDAMTAKVKSWGFPALHDRWQRVGEEPQEGSDLVVSETGTFLIWLRSDLEDKDAGYVSKNDLPEGFTATQVVADYLREMGAFVLRHLRTKYRNDLTMADVEWCVTVPSNWGDHMKKKLQVCMARAGLVRSVFFPEGSPHPLSLVLEGEAASCYCYRNMRGLELKVGDRLLVADIGGKTTDIVVQEWMSETPGDYRVKEVTHKSKDDWGGFDVNGSFSNFLKNKIECLRRLPKKYLFSMEKLVFEQWEEIKCSFGNLETIGESFMIYLPSMLARDWAMFDIVKGNPPRSSYVELELTHADIKAIFDPIVERILALIAKQISRTTNVKVIFVVGGFAGSPYLLTKIKERFLGTVEKVWSPEQPGSAICQGAVMLALSPANRMRYQEYSSEDDSLNTTLFVRTTSRLYATFLTTMCAWASFLADRFMNFKRV